MFSYILRKILYTIPVLWGVVTVVFFVIAVIAIVGFAYFAVAYGEEWIPEMEGVFDPFSYTSILL